MSKYSLQYTDDRDKTYGVTGMAITLVVLDGEQYISELRLDAEPGENIVLSHEFGLRGNPRMSAKIVWEQSVKDLRLSTSMILGNLACRRYVLNHTSINSEDASRIRAAVRDEGHDHCSLDADEADRLFDSCLNYVNRIFRHSGVHDIAHSFSERLSERRTMSGAEAIELLASLGLS